MSYEEFLIRKRFKSILRHLLFFSAVAFIIYNLITPSEAKATSLWGNRGFYFTETKALAKGDIVTIEIKESVRAVHSSSRNNNKNINLAGGNQETSIFTGKNLLSFLPFFKPKLSTEYRGENDVRAEGVFTTRISAVIQKVLPNGNYLISGEKTVQINNELQMVRIEGEVRPEDISADNIVASDKIANAKVYYKSGLNLSDKSNPNPVVKGISKVLDFIF